MLAEAQPPPLAMAVPPAMAPCPEALARLIIMMKILLFPRLILTLIAVPAVDGGDDVWVSVRR